MRVSSSVLCFRVSVSLGPAQLLRRCTHELVQLYTKVNPDVTYQPTQPRYCRVLTTRSEPACPGSCDNTDNDLILRVHDVLFDDKSAAGHITDVKTPSLGRYSAGCRYEVLELMGHGTFGQVVRCRIDGSDDLVAVKVIKNHTDYLLQAKLEIKVLLHLASVPCVRSHIVTVGCKDRCHEPSCGSCAIVQLLHVFSYRKYVLAGSPVRCLHGDRRHRDLRLGCLSRH